MQIIQIPKNAIIEHMSQIVNIVVKIFTIITIMAPEEDHPLQDNGVLKNLQMDQNLVKFHYPHLLDLTPDYSHIHTNAVIIIHLHLLALQDGPHLEVKAVSTVNATSILNPSILNALVKTTIFITFIIPRMKTDYCWKGLEILEVASD
jgi:hypothetical protein